MSNIIKSNYVYVTENDKKIIDFNNVIPASPVAVPVIPGIQDADSSGFKNIDYTDSAYKVDALPKTEEHFIKNEQENNKEFAMQELETIRIEANKLIEDAKIEANDIIEQAKTEALRIKNDSFEEAKNDGYAQGYDIAIKEIEQMKEALKIQEQTNNEEYENNVCELEKVMADVTASLISRITGIEIEDKDVIKHVIHNAFSNIENSQEYLIKVSMSDYDSVMNDRDNLYNYVREGSKIDVVADDSLKKNQCIIETDVNVIDCSLGEQLKNIEKELRMLALT